ncbi:alpha/beta fold hydrolase [Variovorax sp. Varisp85]|uniref:alpha/beta fold hydrolase n=1 Tax=Variovorax sp. Varisp85 TaxID=3243059 RepID=UPI0039A5A358
MARFILVPGGWHGAWAFEAVGNALSGAGHEVQALTLSGLGDEPVGGANLDSHIDEVVQAVRGRDASAVLVGHSYGGMVITGAADKEPSRIKAIVYADAYVPDNGASVWALATPSYRERFIAGAAADGLNCAPPAHLDSRCRPHPIATFLQAIKLTGNWRNVRSKAFIAACGWEGSPFVELYERLRLDPEWATHRLECAHDVPRLAPEALARILLKYV